jgi:phospholipid/cholesterol/gamma-HCH transport system substrate-binding protein
MQRNIAETILGAVVLLVATGFLVFFYKTTDIRPASGYELTASFSKIDGLQPGSEVRISGVKVGQVLGFELDKDSYNAIVHVSIDPSVKLPKDTAAVVASAGLMDGKFMTLEPGGEEEFLKPGDRIEYTQSTPSLEQMLGQFIFSATKNDKHPEEKEDAGEVKDGEAKDGGAPSPAPQEGHP